MIDSRVDLLNMSLEEIEGIFAAIGERGFRAKQVFQWMYKGAKDFDGMTNIPKTLRETLETKFRIGGVEVIKKLSSANSDTIKYLFLLSDHNIIESVVMKYKYGNTLCLSTQVGCRMGCRFCESTRQGLVRNLEAGEMVAQVLETNKDLGSGAERSIRNIVLMGSGEPLDNYDNTLKFIRLIHHPIGMNISYRNITLSTCGLVPEMRRLAGEGIPLTLSVSLHAPCDEIRRRIMPVAAAYSVADVIDASRYYFEKTGRRVTFEYSLIEGVNDGVEHAVELSRRLEGFPCHVNVIPINEIKDSCFHRSSEMRIQQFVKVLSENGIQVTRRRELGQDIEGACGQLKRGFLDEQQIKR